MSDGLPTARSDGGAGTRHEELRGQPDLVTALVPLKAETQRKNRLQLPSRTRHLLADAFASDVLTALADAALVRQTVVIGQAPASFQGPRLADSGAGLNGCLASAAADLDESSTVLAILGDLPCISAADVDQLIAAFHHSRDHGAPGMLASPTGLFVPDATGTGTTCLITPVAHFHPRFGPDSSAEHLAAGFRPYDLPESAPLRRDVDNLSDLQYAVELGVGLATAQATRSLGDLSPSRPRAARMD